MAETEQKKPSLGPTPDFLGTAAQYDEDLETHGFNLLLLGEYGTGKTYNLRTCPKPVWIDMFDPDGGLSLRDVAGTEKSMETGIFVDTRWSYDTIKKPKLFFEWTQEMKRRFRVDSETGKNWFDHIGTYVIDSSTSWTDLIMWDIMARAGKPAGDPQLLSKRDSFQKGWGPQKQAIREYVADLVRQKCNFVLTGHLAPVKDGDGIIEKYEYRVTGNFSEYVPSLFTEIWVCEPKNTSKGIEPWVLTQNAGKITARSRLALKGLLAKREPLDIAAILNKAQFPLGDKPWK